MISRREWLLAALAATGGCATQRRLAMLAEIYGDAGRREPRPPLIVIPGAFGSRLMRRSTREEIWPGSNMELIFGNYRDIELDIDPHTLDPIPGDVASSGLFLKVFGRDFYGEMLDVLESVGGYREGSLDAPSDPPARDYYLYDYDWRLDTIAGVQGLHELIERVTAIHDADRVDIVAHSNGGLMARYYARFGTADVIGTSPETPAFNGSSRIRRLVLVGTPNLGTIQAVLSHVRGEEVGLRRIPPEVVSTCPSVPQLMPHPRLGWLVNLRGEPIGLDMYDIDTWRQLGWSIFSDDAHDRIVRRHGEGTAGEAYFETLEAYLERHLERGRRFHEALSLPDRPDEPKPFIFGSDCIATQARLVVDVDGSTYRAYAQPHRIPMPIPDVDYGALLNEPGDGVVTRSSLLRDLPPAEVGDGRPLPVSESVIVCESHQSLTGNVGFQDMLLDTLLMLDQS